MQLYKPTLFVLVGLPCTGKTSLLKSLNVYNKYPVLSTDDYIEYIARTRGLNYSQAFKDSIDDATKLINNLFVEFGSSDKSVFIDQTNLNVKSRANKLNYFPNHTKVAVYTIPPEGDMHDQWLNYRAQAEGKSIPKRVIDSMKDSFVMPTKEEGFDVIIDSHNFYFTYGDKL